MKKILSLVIILSAFNQITKAQQGFGTSNPAPSSVIDMVATNKGVLMPRVALTSLTVAAPVSSPANALTVFNTATAGSAPNNVTPGYYYWSQADLKWVRLSSSADEPWNVQGGTTKAFTNTQDIYQNGKVGVGNFATLSSPQKQLEVKGDFKSEITAAGGAVGTEVGSPLNPNGAMHYWFLNPTNYRTASANDFSATLEAKTGSVTNTVSARDIQAALSSQNGTNSLSSVRANNAGEFYMEAFNVTGNYGSTVSLLSDALRLVHTDTNGPSDPFPNNNRSEIKVQKTEGVSYSFRNASGAVTGSYFFPLTSGTNGQVMVQTATGKMDWANPSSLNTNTTLSISGGQLIYANELANNPNVPLISAEANNGTIAGTDGRLFSNNIYNANGTLTGNRLVNTSTFNLTFGNGSNRVVVNNTAANTGMLSAIGTGRGILRSVTTGGSFVEMFVDDASNSQVVSGGSSTGMIVGTSIGSNTPLSLATAGTTRMRVSATGLIGVGSAPASATEQFDVTSGNVRVRDIVSNAGVASDKLVVADGNGVLKTVDQSSVTIEPWQIIGGTNKATANTDNIYQMGNVAIGATSIPTIIVGASTINPKFYVAGDISTTGKIYTTSSVYADYVFEKYFKGSSEINPNYEFKSLNYVRDFIKANNHLPGVESINDLSKVKNGYTFDMTKLTIQSLEKIEELYIHAIEQKDKIDAQKLEIDQLKQETAETKNRLEKLEKLLFKN